MLFYDNYIKQFSEKEIRTGGESKVKSLTYSIFIFSELFIVL